ncbi:hypothetical protein KIW84_071685 [Lathyrus oleraceus]|uniref:Uncharacterized protein n=1 Tax=Pisum sativum TaxID=3888 RepID=A0A9D4VJD1_PEA|nr:hypothetical protein KIW84_071685 [Pisum sativum]
MEETKSIDRVDMVLRLFLDRTTTNFPNQVMIDEKVEDILKEDNKQKVVAGFPPPLPQEYHKHDPHATCGYHAGYVGNSTETCHVLKDIIQELIDQKMLSFTHVIAGALLV